MTPQPNSTFNGLGIAPRMLEVLTRAQYTTPTPIQAQSIPVSITGKDIVGIAQTGTGKTLAFAVPLVQRIVAAGGGRALIVVPTRELALQVEETIQRIARPFNMRSTVLIGGMSMGGQIQQLRRNPSIIVATPGRLLDHLQQKTVHLHDVHALVLDEADRMFDMGFMPAITKILQALPKERQTMLFSATMPPEIMRLAGAHMKMPVRVEVALAGTAAERVMQEIIFVSKEQKGALLTKVLGETRGTVLVFSRTKHGARKITRAVSAAGHAAAEIHSDRTLAQRRRALDGFKNGTYRVLVATDIAARGIDVKGIELVLNYDLPDAAEDYVHRIGRTGRAGHEGHAISFATPDQRRDIVSIERLIRKQIPVKQVGGMSAAPSVERAPQSQRRPFGPRPQRPRGHFGSPSRAPFRGSRTKRTIM